MGWLTLHFDFNRETYEVTHLNRGPYYRLIVQILKEAEKLQGDKESIIHEEKIKFRPTDNKISFNSGQSWDNILTLPIEYRKILQSLKEKTITLEGNATKNPKDIAISFDYGKTWLDIEASKKALADEWYKKHPKMKFGFQKFTSGKSKSSK